MRVTKCRPPVGWALAGTPPGSGRARAGYERRECGPAYLRASLIAGPRGASRLGLWAFTAMASSISAWGTESPQAHSQKKSSEYFFSCLLAFFTPKEDLENELAFCTKEDEENFD